MILLPLLEQGLDIYGFDISEEMLNILYAKAASMKLENVHARVSRQDLHDFHYHHSFDAIIIPARSFLHLTEQEDQIACLATAYDHLKPCGRLLLNFFNPHLDLVLERADPASAYRLLRTFDHPETGESIELSSKQVNDIPTQIQHITWRFKQNEVIHETNMQVRWIYREEFKLLLRLAGFTKWNLYGGFDRSPFTSRSSEMVWIARK